ncbi:MATE family efflux transporter [uncultured Vibrio sp.]|uniref:MATE family efflux transporter n=1 Tax=uncultured Vibrio sp. TaxID=114054 RepID=UPI0025DAC86C|nr:MATE family efflux transporter [uncultured Vibrio sp.]
MSETTVAQTDSTQKLALSPITPLFVQTALPICLGLLMAGLYNVVDGIFIARWVGSEAIGAVSTVFPLQMLIAAIGAMVSSGTASILTRSLGQGKIQDAGIIAGSALELATIISLFFFVVGFGYLSSILDLLSVPDLFYDSAYTYAAPITMAAFVSLYLPVIADIFRAEGKVQAMMMLILTSSFLNIVLDFLFIVVLNKGVEGAAIATVLAQLIAVGIGAKMYLSGKTLIRIQCKFRPQHWMAIALLGVPILMAQLSVAIQAGLINYQFDQVANEGWISAYGIIGRLSGFVILPLIAMLIAFQTICGYNLGAKALDRVSKSINIALILMTLYASVMMLIIVLIPETLMRIFTEDSDIIGYGKAIIYASIWGLPFTGVTMIATGYYQAKGQATFATFYSSLRVVILMSPLLLMMPKYWGINGIFSAMVIGDIAAAAITLALCLKSYRNLQPNREPKYADA